MPEENNPKMWEQWDKYEKLKISLLKSIYLNMRVQSSFLTELLAYARKEKYPITTKRFDDLYKHVKDQFRDWMFAEYGKIDLKDILPEEPPKHSDLAE